MEVASDTSSSCGVSNNPGQLKLKDGSRVGVIGGGPAGSFFSYFLLQMAERVGLELAVDLYEPRDYSCQGPKGCNMCGGIISESLMQNLAAEGIQLPSKVVQRRIDSYFLHMDVGSVRIEAPRQELRIASVARGSGPRGAPCALESFDGFLLDMALQRGAQRISERVASVEVHDQRPRIRTNLGTESDYDLVVGAAGVNTQLLKAFEELGEYKQPRQSKAYVAEFHLGQAMIERYLANSMHVFLLNLPRLDFAALIPKHEFVTICLLGEEIDKSLVDAFLDSREVREVLPPQWRTPKDFCHCAPKLNVQAAIKPYGDRLVFIGDCGTTRLFKDGIGAAYRTAKAAARTAIFRGVGAEDFRHSYWPTCKAIHSDNRLGKAVFSITRSFQKNRPARRGLWRMTSREQALKTSERPMSATLWDTFTGSAPYKSVLFRSLKPGFVWRLVWETLAGFRSGTTRGSWRQDELASGRTGQVGRVYSEGQVIYEQGEPGDCMHILVGGRAEVIRQEDDRSYSLPALEDGDFFGELAVFHERLRPTTVRALDEVCIVSLKRADLVQRIHEDPSMAFRLIERMADRISALEDSLIHNSALPAEPWKLSADARAELSPAEGIEPESSATAGLMGRKCCAGEVIYRQGDPGDCMYIIRGGEVESVCREAEEELYLPILGDGDFFGELALFGAEIRPTTIRALTDVHIFSIERNSLIRQVHEDASMAFRLIEKMATRIAKLEEALVHHGPQLSSVTLLPRRPGAAEPRTASQPPA